MLCPIDSEMWCLESGPYKAIYLKIWSQVDETVWEELEGMALLEEVCHLVDFCDAVPCECSP